MQTLPRILAFGVMSTALAGVVFGAAANSLADFQAAAAQNHCTLVLPNYPVTAAELTARADAILKQADTELDAIAALPADKLTFESTFVAFDAVTGRVSDFDALVQSIAQSSTSAEVRAAANEADVKLQGWGVALDYREPVYRALKAVADRHLTLDAEQQRLMDFQMRTYRRAGLSLAPADRQKAEQMRKDLAALNNEFARNINQARAPLDFTAEEMKGVPTSFLESPGVKQADGRYRVMANITWHAQVIGENADNPDVRRRVLVARSNLAHDVNQATLTKLVILRADIAHLLGYANWADYQIEVRMAKNAATAVKFEEDLVAGLDAKFQAEKETLRKLKAEQTGNASAQLDPWDINYYTNRLKKEKFAVDAEALRVYFPYQATLEGMFAIYEKIFGLKFTAVTPPYVWTPGVQLYVVADSRTHVPMGAFYLDMFPREGKYNHFACFVQKIGGLQSNGIYDLPVSALLCNFPAPTPGKPSLLEHADVETLFHEFGHVMHSMLSRSRFYAQNAFATPQDFVEGPSQMLENWVWDKAVLDTFAADYRDPSKKIPASVIDSLVAARQATEGMFNRRQLAIGLLDLSLHTLTPEQARQADVIKLTNDVTARVSVAPPKDTFWAGYIGHLAGYDAGYYGYLWSKVMAIDMASAFKAAPGGFLDETVGRRLRDEVYSRGDTRDVGVSVEKFLGRPRSTEPFLEYVGYKK